MDFFKWFMENFGFFFGSVFLFYLYLMVRRLVSLYDYLRHVPDHPDKACAFLDPFFKKLEQTAEQGKETATFVADAIWAEIDARVMVHFQAITGYISTLVLIGFAGTIFGSIGAFNEMFKGLATGKAAALVFAASWDKGLSTALYTSLGAAAIGGVVLTLIGSRFLLSKAKELEAMVSWKICKILSEKNTQPVAVEPDPILSASISRPETADLDLINPETERKAI